MAKYLNNDGITYLWKKIKDYVDNNSSSGGGTNNSAYVVTSSYNNCSASNFTRDMAEAIANGKYSTVQFMSNNSSTFIFNIISVEQTTSGIIKYILKRSEFTSNNRENIWICGISTPLTGSSTINKKTVYARVYATNLSTNDSGV